MTAIDFYYGVSSGNSSRVAFALHEIGAAYTPHRLHVPDGEARAPEYLALNPMGKVPALIHGTTRLWESNAINWYLAELHPQAGLLPGSLAGRASVQRWLYFQVGHVAPACLPVFRFTNRRVQAFWRTQGDAASAEAGRRELARYLPVLDEALAARDWLDGDFSLADIAYAPHLWMVAEGGFDFAPTPRVRDWLDRLLARPAWRAARELVFGV
jgi:GST-like protein